MFERLEKRGRERAEARAELRRRELAAAAREAAPCLEVDIEGEAVVLSGRDLTRRFVEDAALRWLAWEARYER